MTFRFRTLSTWDIGMIGEAAARAKVINFSHTCVEIPATYSAEES